VVAATEKAEQAGNEEYHDDHMGAIFKEGFSFSGYERDLLAMNLGNGKFLNVSGVSGVDSISDGRGSVFADLDNDGDQDLVIANGHIYPQVDAHPEFRMKYAQRNQLLENIGGGRFVEATERAGPGFEQARSSRGLAAGDYDDDGDLDLLFTHLDETPTLLRNDSARGSWITVVCSVEPGDGPLIGTRVEIEVAGNRQWRDVASGGSFLSVHDPRLHFGLGDAARVDRVTVHWPDGTVSLREDVEANRFLEIAKSANVIP